MKITIKKGDRVIEVVNEIEVSNTPKKKLLRAITQCIGHAMQQEEEENKLI